MSSVGNGDIDLFLLLFTLIFFWIGWNVRKIARHEPESNRKTRKS
jgi:hypothetical protein